MRGRTARVGSRVLVFIGQTGSVLPGESGWWEPATVTAIDGDMATVQFDEVWQLPEAYGGGSMFILDREIDELEVIG